MGVTNAQPVGLGHDSASTEHSPPRQTWDAIVIQPHAPASADSAKPRKVVVLPRLQQLVIQDHCPVCMSKMRREPHTAPPIPPSHR